MKAELAEGKSGYKSFAGVSSMVYKYNKYHRGTEDSIEKMLVKDQSAFHNHATVKPFVISDGNDLVARFALIHDKNLPDYIQVSFFEAAEGLGDIFSIIKQKIKEFFPNIQKIVVGLNGHLNYGAGFLLNRFDEVPLFGLPYSQPYYMDYFKELHQRNMFSYRFPMEVYSAWAQSYKVDKKLDGMTVRFMNKKQIKKESAIYTYLNNHAFLKHPYWANRNDAEDLELFYPFRFFLDNENLIIAELNNEPVGFYLWYPDFNQLVNSDRDFNVFDLIKYRIISHVDTFRFTEIGILPKFQGTPVAMAMLNKSLPKLLDQGFKFCEGGFIFEENRASIAFVSRILQRCTGNKPEPYRCYAVFETTL